MSNILRSIAATVAAFLLVLTAPAAVSAQSTSEAPGVSTEHSPDMDPNGLTARHSPDMDPNGSPTVPSAVFLEHSPDMDPNGLKAAPADPRNGPFSWLHGMMARLLDV